MKRKLSEKAKKHALEYNKTYYKRVRQLRKSLSLCPIHGTKVKRFTYCFKCRQRFNKAAKTYRKKKCQ